MFLQHHRPAILFVLLGSLLLIGAPVQAQDAPSASRQDAPDSGARIEGTVVSVRRGSFTLRTNGGRYHVFPLGSARPARPLRAGMRVAVMTRDDDDADTPRVLAIAILPDQPADDTPARPPAPAADDPVPPDVRALETSVERQLRRFNAGVVGGVSAQPELIMVGGHATFERVFRPPVSVRPGLQLGFGEVSTLLALDIDVIYTLARPTGRAQWAPYVGAGPSVLFLHRSFEGEEDDGTRFDFGDFDAENGFNFIVGMRRRNGAFFEMKATASGVSDVRLLAGVTF
jgi:hypothetical protein